MNMEKDIYQKSGISIQRMFKNKLLILKINKMERKAYLEVSLEKAREWYDGDNKELKRLALKVFSKEVLIPSFEEIVGLEKDWTLSSFPTNILKQITPIIKLQLVANYLNKGWKREIGNVGYFLKSYPVNKTNIEENIGMHQSIAYPGIVYFKSTENVKRAIEILEKELHE